MPLGVVEDNEFEQELEDVIQKPVVNSEVEIIDQKSPGRNPGDNNVPDEVRQFIAESHMLGASGRELADTFGVSQSSVSAYANGATSTATYDKKNVPLVNHLNRAKERITRKARRVMINSLDSLTEEKLLTVKAKDAALIARSMAGIIKDLEPEVVQNITDNRVQFVMFAPAIKQERSYDAIDVSVLDGE